MVFGHVMSDELVIFFSLYTHFIGVCAYTTMLNGGW